jgi:hypothetical protein
MEYIILQANTTFCAIKLINIHNTRGRLIFMDGIEDNLKTQTTPTETKTLIALN